MEKLLAVLFVIARIKFCMVCALVIIFFLAGCGGIRPATYSWHYTYAEGRLTPRDQNVPHEEFTLGVIEVFGGTGSVTTPGTGSIRGRDPVTLRTRVRRF